VIWDSGTFRALARRLSATRSGFGTAASAADSAASDAADWGVEESVVCLLVTNEINFTRDRWDNGKKITSSDGMSSFR
jgi:hypothetical protein